MKRVRLWLIPLVVIAAGVLAYDRFTTSAWVGRTDLESEFVVVDANTGQSLEGAAIEVQRDEGDFCEDRSAKKFEMLTDRNGIARRLSAAPSHASARKAGSNSKTRTQFICHGGTFGYLPKVMNRAT